MNNLCVFSILLSTRTSPTAEHSLFLKGHKVSRAHMMLFTLYKNYFPFNESNFCEARLTGSSDLVHLCCHCSSSSLNPHKYWRNREDMTLEVVVKPTQTFLVISLDQSGPCRLIINELKYFYKEWFLILQFLRVPHKPLIIVMPLVA